MSPRARILNGTLDPGLIQGRLVFVGVTEIGIGDLLPTPADTLFPGVAMHATVAANVINSDYQFDNLDTMLINVALIAVIPLFGVLVMSSQRKLTHMLISGAVIVGLLWWVFAYVFRRQPPAQSPARFEDSVSYASGRDFFLHLAAYLEYDTTVGKVARCTS